MKKALKGPTFLLLFLSVVPMAAPSAADRNSQTTSLMASLKVEMEKSKKARKRGEVFFNSLSEERYGQALIEWFRVFEGGPFSKTPTGKALSAYLLFKNGLEVQGVEDLFLSSRPKSIHKDLRQLWRLAAPSRHPVWTLSQPNWTSGWTDFFGRETQLVMKAHSSHSLREREIASLLSKTNSRTPGSSGLRLRMALNLATEAKGTAKSLKILKDLMSVPPTHVDKNLVAVSIGRILYAKKKWARAVEYYKKVSKDSEYWFTAREEMAWALMAQGKSEKVVGITKTLMHPGFAPHLSAEAVFLHAYSQLSACDYLGVAESVDLFKEKFKKKVKALMALEKEGVNGRKGSVGTRLFDQLKRGNSELLALGKTAHFVPRYVSRDGPLLREVQLQKSLDVGLARLRHLASEGSDRKPLKGSVRKSLNRLEKSINSRYKRSKRQSFRLLAKRAKEEIDDIRDVLFKISILETEMLQRVAIVTAQGGREAKVQMASGQGQKGDIRSGGKDKYALSFPYKGEIWFDELNHYRLNLQKICQKRRAL